MSGIVKIFTDAAPPSRKDDDFTDRLSHHYTVLLLVVFAGVVGVSQLVGEVIVCFVPQHFTGSHTKYTNSYCWVRNTYYLPVDEHVPSEEESANNDYIPYYQWISLILVGQAILFAAPSCVWHGLNQSGGIDADKVLETAGKLDEVATKANYDDTLMIVVNQIKRFLSFRQSANIVKRRREAKKLGDEGKDPARQPLFFSSRRFGCYLVIIYCISKLLYLINVVGQLFMLNSILSLDYHIYGIEVFSWMMDNYDWTTSPQVAFPRVTMCDFKVRRLGNIHRYTVQCTLPINLYNEKIYMFLWFWLVFVAIVTAVSLVTWIVRIVSVTDRERYIQNHLKMMGKVDKQSNDVDDDTRRFVRSYLRHDGVFLLRLIGHNTNTLTVSEIIGALWDNRPQHLRSGPIKSTHEEDPSDPDSNLPLKPGFAESTA